jgi:hypothetical protein
MKKNGQEFLEVLDERDARTGWKLTGGGRDVDKACAAWLEKNCPQKKKKRRFGNY